MPPPKLPTLTKIFSQQNLIIKYTHKNKIYFDILYEFDVSISSYRKCEHWLAAAGVINLYIIKANLILIDTFRFGFHFVLHFHYFPLGLASISIFGTQAYHIDYISFFDPADKNWLVLFANIIYNLPMNILLYCWTSVKVMYFFRWVTDRLQP